jgi:hypothetical protein
MFEAARVGDDIGHSGALAGMIAGTIVGGLIAAAGGILAGAMFIAGLGASCLGVGVLLVGASLAVGYYTGELATAARDSIADAGASSMTKKGVITSGSPNVFINGKPAAMATDSTVTALTTARSRWPKALRGSQSTACLRPASGIAPPATRR